MQKFKVALLGINSLFGQISSLLLKQSNFIKRLKLYDEHNIEPAKDISAINTSCKVEAYKGKDQLNDAVKDTDIIIIGDDNFSTPHTAFELMAPKICDYARVIASTSPNAIIVIAASPVNILVPLFSEALKDCGCYDCNKVIGATSVDSIRASCILASHMKVNPQKVTVPVIGGASRETRVPLFSQAKPLISLPHDVKKKLTEDIKQSEMEVFAMKKTPEALNKAYSTIRFVNSILLGLRGEQDIVNIAFSRTTQVSGTEYFSLPVQFGRFGIMKRFGIPKILPVENELIEESAYYLNKDIELANHFFKNRENAQEIFPHDVDKQYVEPLFDSSRATETTDMVLRDKPTQETKNRKINSVISIHRNNVSVNSDFFVNNQKEIIVKPWDKPFDTRAFWLKHKGSFSENKPAKTESKPPSTFNINDTIIFRKENIPSCERKKPDSELPQHRPISSLTSLEDPGELIPHYSSRTLLMDTILKKTIEKSKAEQRNQEVLTNLATGKNNDLNNKNEYKKGLSLEFNKAVDRSKDNLKDKTTTNRIKFTTENISETQKNKSLTEYPLSSLNYSFSDKVKKIFRKHKDSNTDMNEYMKKSDVARPQKERQHITTLSNESSLPAPVFSEFNDFRKDAGNIYALVKQGRRQQNTKENKKKFPCSIFDSFTAHSTTFHQNIDKGLTKKNGSMKSQMIQKDESANEQTVLKKECIKDQMGQKREFLKGQVIHKDDTKRNKFVQKYESRKGQLIQKDEVIIKGQIQTNEPARDGTDSMKALHTKTTINENNIVLSEPIKKVSYHNVETISSKPECNNEDYVQQSDISTGSQENNRAPLLFNSPNNFFVNYNKNREESISYLKSRKVHYDKLNIEEDERYFSEIDPARKDFNDDPVVHLIDVLNEDVYSDNFIESLNEPNNSSATCKTDFEQEDLSNKQLLDKNSSVLLECITNKEENLKSSLNSKFNVTENNESEMATVKIDQNKKQVVNDKSICQNANYVPIPDTHPVFSPKQNTISVSSNSKQRFLDSRTSGYNCSLQSQDYSRFTLDPANCGSECKKSAEIFSSTPNDNCVVHNCPLNLTSKNRCLTKMDLISIGCTNKWPSNHYNNSNNRTDAAYMNLNKIKGILVTNIKNKSYNEKKTSLKYNQSSKNSVKSMEGTKYSNVEHKSNIQFNRKDSETAQNDSLTSGISSQVKYDPEIINSNNQCNANSLKILKMLDNVNRDHYKISSEDNSSLIKDQPNIPQDSIRFSHNKLYSITNPKNNIKSSAEGIKENPYRIESISNVKHLSCLPMTNPLSNLKSIIQVERNQTPRRFARYSTTTQLRNKSPSRVYVDKLKSKLIKPNQSHQKLSINPKKIKRISNSKAPQSLLKVLEQKFQNDNNWNKTKFEQIPLTKINDSRHLKEKIKPPNNSHLSTSGTNVVCQESVAKNVKSAFVEPLVGFMPNNYFKSYAGNWKTSEDPQQVIIPKMYSNSSKYVSDNRASNSQHFQRNANTCSQIIKNKYHNSTKAFQKLDGSHKMQNDFKAQCKVCENFIESSGLSNIYGPYVKDFVEFKYPKKHKTSTLFT